MRSSRKVGAALILAGLAGCGPDDALVAERDRLAAEVETLRATTERLEKEADTLHAQVQQLRSALSRAEKREILQKLRADAGPIRAEIVTDKGSIRCELWPEVAPRTVLNFVELAEGGREWTDPRTGEKTTRPLYDGTTFHRVVPEFMIQGGDPLGTGEGGPGYRFEDEIDPKVTFDKPGLLAMANAGPNTNGSQFFVTDRGTPQKLNGRHTIFGQCGDADVVEAIAMVPRDAKDKPLSDVRIQTVRIQRP